MKELIDELKSILNSKPAPGPILNNLTEVKLKELSKNYKHDSDALWIGSLIADMFITEAKDTGNILLHVPMALDYAKEIIKKNSIPKNQAEIVLELIETHHGGEQKFIESKLYKNADCFKFLDPKGVFHIFSAFYKNDEASFKEAIEYAMFKLEEKYSLIDLDEKTINEAKDLYNKWQNIFNKMDYKLVTPDLYKK